MYRLVYVISLLLLVPRLGSAEGTPDKANWASLRQLAPGDQIQVVLNDAKSYRGQFQAVSDDAIVVRVAAGEQSFPRETVLRVSAKGKSHRGRNELIGAAIGAGVAGLAVGIDASHHRAGQIDVAGALSLGVPFAAGFGAGIGALVPTGGWQDVYRAR